MDAFAERSHRPSQIGDGNRGLRHSPRMRCIALILIVLGFPRTSLAQTSAAHYEIPCQTQRTFLDRLRAITGRSDRVAGEFSIVVRALGPDSWTLVVERLGEPRAEPRSVQDSRCEALADAAVLVVSAWMREAPEQRAAPDVDAKAVGASTSIAAPRTRWLRGIGVRAAGGTGLIRTPSLGVGVEFWFSSPARTMRIAFGGAYWPMADHLPEAERTDRFVRQVGEAYVQMTGNWLRTADLTLGPYAELAIVVNGPSPGHGGQMDVRGALGAGTRWTLSERWALDYHLGVGLLPARVQFGVFTSLGLALALW